MNLAESLKKKAQAAAHDALSCGTPRSGGSKFRSRGKVGAAATRTPATPTGAEEDPTNDVEMLIPRGAAGSDAAPKKPVPVPKSTGDGDDTFRLPEDERIKRYMDAAASLAEGQNAGCASCLRAATPAVTILVLIITKVAPIYLWLFRKAYWVYTWAPKNLLTMIFGAALCFFGGTYVAAIAAVEAWRQMGWQRSWADLKCVYLEMRAIYDASNLDDLVDADGNGVVDVAEISPQELATRKLKLAMTTVKEPEKLQTAVGSLWAAYLAVLATLRLEFARVAALALGIAEMVKFPVVRFVSPPLSAALGPELKHWVPTLITTTINIVAVAFAWYVQKIISAFYSALRGGKMFGEALFALLDEYGLLKKLPFIKQPFDHNESYLDEIAGYLIAAAGFYTQLRYGFSLAFPLNLVFLPLSIVEWILEYQIVMGAPGAASG